MILLQTIHGSRLSGLARPDSDWDWYTVVDNGKTRQRISGDQDKLTVTLDDFLNHVADGEVAALCALWSPVADIEPNYKPLFMSLHPSMMGAARKFGGAITAFSVFGTGQRNRPVGGFDAIDIKAKQHMLRLSLLLANLWLYGHFNPQLDAQTIRWITGTARTDQETFTAEVRRVCPVTLTLGWDVPSEPPATK